MNESTALRLRKLAQAAESEARDRLQIAHAEYLSRLNQVCTEEFARFLDRSQELLQASPYERLNQAAQRMLRSTDRYEFAQALLDVSPNSSVFVVEGDLLKFLAANPSLPEPPPETIALQSAPALANAAESRETVVALRSGSQLSPTVAALFSGLKVFIVPIVESGRTAALVVSDAASDIHALELLAAVGGDSIGREPVERDPEPVQSQPAPTLIQIAPAPAQPPPEPPSPADLRARRFASVEVAKLLLERPGEIERGRQQRDLYSPLRDFLETSRSRYRQDYISTLPRRVDYFHQELVRTLAHDQEALLGPEYPGPLS